MSIETILESLPQLTREQRQTILAAHKEVADKQSLIYLELFRIRKGMEVLLEVKLETNPE